MKGVPLILLEHSADDPRPLNTFAVMAPIHPTVCAPIHDAYALAGERTRCSLAATHRLLPQLVARDDFGVKGVRPIKVALTRKARIFLSDLRASWTASSRGP